jgi:succinate dehydrogenase / fumarate reductase flavoprotein subunit
MDYYAGFRESLERVKATRSSRRTQQIPRLSPAEKQTLLEEYHPDYRISGFREIRGGANKGEMAPRELVDVLEAPSRLMGITLDLARPHHRVEVLVIGGGGGGSAAALAAREAGAAVLMATKLRHGDSNTVMAEGGIGAATRPDDSPSIHYVDTIRGGRFANVPELVRALVTDAPGVVEWLERLGVLFDRVDDGNILTHTPAGHSRPRSHSCRDMTGLEIMRVLRDEMRSAQIPVLEFSPVVELLTDPTGACAGAVLLNLDTRRHVIVHAKKTILATGGIGRLHIQGFPTTNHYGATADGLVVAYHAGARLLYVDSVQYHPTGVVWPEQMLGLLISEHLRAKGAQLVDCEGDRFINELETRDAISSAIIRACTTGNRGVPTPGGRQGIWLDTPLIDALHGRGAIERQFTGIHHRFQKFGIDVTQAPILIYPAQHYQNGGIAIDAWSATVIPNLYAVGEVAGGVHGRNRLGSNSLVDILVFGRRAGRHAAETLSPTWPGPATLDHLDAYHAELERLGVAPGSPAPLLLPDYGPSNRAEAVR